MNIKRGQIWTHNESGRTMYAGEQWDVAVLEVRGDTVIFEVCEYNGETVPKNQRTPTEMSVSRFLELYHK